MRASLHLTHGVAPGDVAQGARALADALPHVPAGVHLAVVDPGVGTDRRALVLATGDGRFLVGPDNGLLIAAAERCGGVVAAYELAVPRRRRAHLPRPRRVRAGRRPPGAGRGAGELGTAVDAGRARPPGRGRRRPSSPASCAPRASTSTASATARWRPRASDLDAAGLIAGGAVAIAVRGHPRGAAQRGRTFADVPPGALVVLVDSTGSAALCINGGDAARELRLAVGDDVELRLPND